MFEHESDQQVAMKTIVGGQRLNVFLVFRVKAVKADLPTLLVKVMTHHASKIQNLIRKNVKSV